MVDTVPELVGAHEIRASLGNVSRQRTYQITSRADFPEPVADLAQGKVWLARDVDAWIVTHRRPRTLAAAQRDPISLDGDRPTCPAPSRPTSQQSRPIGNSTHDDTNR
jgi:prophage regulatory protein